jgi:DNA-binding IclR family transcriptional regulator
MGPKKVTSAGIQSIEVGVPLLIAFMGAPEAMSLTALAKSAGMSSSKAHKYLASYMRAGLVTQDAPNGSYRLGPLAMELGLTALRHLNAVDIAEGPMLALRNKLELMVLLTVWANRGPTVVRRVETRQMRYVTMRLGSVLPLLTSAAGRVFLAYLDRHHTKPVIEVEFKAPRGMAAKFGLRGMKDVENLIAKIRVEGVAEIDGFVSGDVAISAPIFDATDTIAASLTVVGRHDSNVRNAKPALIAAADSLSHQLGASRRAQMQIHAPPTRKRSRRAGRNRSTRGKTVPRTRL